MAWSWDQNTMVSCIVCQPSGNKKDYVVCTKEWLQMFGVQVPLGVCIFSCKLKLFKCCVIQQPNRWWLGQPTRIHSQLAYPVNSPFPPPRTTISTWWAPYQPGIPRSTEKALLKQYRGWGGRWSYLCRDDIPQGGSHNGIGSFLSPSR